MKKVIIAIAILTVILTAGILETVYVDKIFDKLDAKLSDIEQTLLDEDNSAIDKSNQLYDWWESKREIMELFLYSPDVRSFSVAIGEIQGSLECDDTQNALSKVRSLMVMSANIHRILDFNLADII